MANETLEQLGNALEAAQQKIGAVAEEVSEQAYNELVAIRREKLRGLQEAGNDPFELTSYPQADFAAEVKESFVDVPEGEQGRSVCMAGRMMSKRVMGKASFADLRDTTGNIQLYVRRDDVGVEEYQAFKKFDIGDIIGVRGFVFRTKMGEISVHATEVTLLSKSLLPLPEKFHGLRDTELRFRQRYVDLIMNPEVRRTFEVRSKFIKFMRKYLDDMGYMEVETPVLNTISGGATARPFITHHNTLNLDMYMRIATELPLKRLIVGGLDRVYEIGRIFRNEGMDPKHNPEFTTIELYEAYADFHDMMDIAEGVLSTAAKEILGSYRVTWLGNEIDLTPGWKRMTMIDAVREYVGVDFEAISDDEEACKAAEAKGIDLEGCERTWGTALYEAFDQRVEEKLIQPTFITMYPVEVSPLTKRSPKDPRLTERFELFINHCEFANAFSELNDPIDQRGRFEHELALREMGNDEAGMMDEDFINALEYGLPPTGGMGIGIDRCVMLLTNSDSIRDVILFPTMKPLEQKRDESKAGNAAVNVSAEAASVSAPSVQIDLTKVKIEPLFADEVDFETFSKSDFRVVKIEACEAVPKSKKLLKFTLNDGTDRKRTILSGIHEYYEPEELVGKTCVAITNLPSRKMMGIDSEGMLISAVYEYDGREGLNLLMLDDNIPAGAKLY